MEVGQGPNWGCSAKEKIYQNLGLLFWHSEIRFQSLQQDMEVNTKL
jgi:hypothetical protein